LSEALRARTQKLAEKESTLEKNFVERCQALESEKAQVQKNFVERCQTLESEKAQVQSDRKKLEDEKVQMEGIHQVHPSFHSFLPSFPLPPLHSIPFIPSFLHQFQTSAITLNVGGNKFTTTLGTLTSLPGTKLALMFSGRFEMKAAEDGSYFIDRDGTHFRHILNFLRDKSFKPLLGPEAMQELIREAEHYNLLEHILGATTLNFVRPFDTNGVLYYIATNNKTTEWSNPFPHLVKAEASSSGQGHDVHHLTSNGAEGFFCTLGKTKSHFTVDISKSWENPTHAQGLEVSHYVLKSPAHQQLRSWRLEGLSFNGDWVLLKEHSSDESWTDNVGSWEVENSRKMRYCSFRITITGKNSKNKRHLACSGIELYGTLYPDHWLAPIIRR
jgi:hypothetical protein